MPELLGQFTPGLSGAGDVEDGLEKHPIGRADLGVVGRVAAGDHRTHDPPALDGEVVSHGATRVGTGPKRWDTYLYSNGTDGIVTHSIE